MLSFLKNHPFAVEAFFDYSLVLTYAVPKHEAQKLIPDCLTLDTFADKWAFIAVALVQTKALRPEGFPAFMGNDFFLIGYRVFVRYTTAQGKRLRGLYILKSETNRKRMEVLGSIFTRYNYDTTDITQTTNGTVLTIASQASGLNVVVDTDPNRSGLPSSSPFATWKEARQFAGPLPFTFSFNESTKTVLIIEGTRQHWQPTPVQVLRDNLTFFDSINMANHQLANAFLIQDIPYVWKRGRTELWNP